MKKQKESNLPDCATCFHKMWYPPEDRFMCVQNCTNGFFYLKCEPVRLYKIEVDDGLPKV